MQAYIIVSKEKQYHEICDQLGHYYSLASIMKIFTIR